MKISERDKDVIARCGLHADASLSALARLSGHKIHTVRQSLDRLKQRGVLKRVWLVDTFRLGWTRYQVFFASGIRNARSKERLITFLSKCPRVSFLAETGGDFDYEVLFLGKHSGEVTALLEECARRCGEVAVSKSVIVHESVAFFPRKYLAQGAYSGSEVTFKHCDEPLHPLSDLDHRILQLLSKAPEVTKRSIAIETGKSLPTIDQHISSLRQQSILRGALFSVDSSHFGGQYFVIMIHARGFDSALNLALHQFAANHPNCTNFRRCFGSWDFELGVEVLHPREIMAVKEELYEKFALQIASMRVLSRFKVHKYVLYPL